MNDVQNASLRRGLCLILSSPSGAGKTTLARLLLAEDPLLAHSISVTTRRPRPQEREGVDYYFVARSRFDALREEGSLLEWAEVFGNLYGTPSEPVHKMLSEGRDVVFDVDWQGAGLIAAALPQDTVRVFILPPSAAELARRIYSRASDTPAVIRERLEAATVEISHWRDYDYVIVNHDIGGSLSILRAILQAERHKRDRQTWLPAFVSTLTAQGQPVEPSNGAAGQKRV